MKKLKDYVEHYQLTMKTRNAIIAHVKSNKIDPLEIKVGDTLVSLPAGELKHIAKLQKRYEKKHVNICQYGAMVTLNTSFYRGTVARVLRPHYHHYGYSVYVQIIEDPENAPLVLLDIDEMEVLDVDNEVFETTY